MLRVALCLFFNLIGSDKSYYTDHKKAKLK